MSTIFDAYDKDKELALSPLAPQVKKGKKRGIGGYIVASILAFILGVSATLGGILVGAKMLVSQTVGTMVTTITPIVGVDYTTKVNAFLRYLEEYTLKEVPDKLQTLSVGEIFYSNIFLADEESTGISYYGYYLNTGAEFKDANDKTIYRSDFYIKVLKEGSTDEYNYYHFDPLTTFDSPEHELAIEEQYGITLNVELNRQWKYLLNDKDREDKTATQYRFDYSIFNGMDSLTDNMTVNVHYATLGDLYEDDILQLDGDNENLLNTPVHTSLSILNGSPISLGLSFENSLPENPQIRHLTIAQMIEYNMAILNFIDGLTN